MQPNFGQTQNSGIRTKVSSPTRTTSTHLKSSTKKTRKPSSALHIRPKAKAKSTKRMPPPCERKRSQTVVGECDRSSVRCGAPIRSRDFRQKLRDLWGHVRTCGYRCAESICFWSGPVPIAASVNSVHIRTTRYLLLYGVW